jgi:hypothetical protein
LTISTGSGNNTLNVANTGFSLDAIQGPVSFHGGSGSNTLNVNDQAGTAAETYTILPTSVQRLESTGLSALINFDGGVTALNVNGTTTGFTSGLFNVLDTPKNAVTTLNTGSDNSTVNVKGTTGALVISATGGAQFVTIGLNNSVASINDAVTITNSIGETGLTVNDAKGPAAPNVTLGVDAHGFGFITGLAPGQINYAQNDIRGLTVNGPQAGATYTITDTAKSNKVFFNTLIVAGLNGGNIFNVQKTSGELEIEGEAGKNTVTIGSTANTLDTIQGPVTVLGALGGDTLTINDQGSKTPHTYNQGVNFLKVGFLIRSGAAEIDFKSIASLHVNKGPVAGSTPQAEDLAVTSPVVAGQLATLTGRLVDADQAQALSLTVDWGDGSDPDRSTPGQAPFSLTHRYATPGTYTVRAIWSDSAGESNSQDLALTVTPTPNQRFVTRAFQDLLGRAPDAGGLAYWVAQLDQGVPRSAVAEQLTHSAEYYATIIRPAYQQFLGRDADDAGVAFWTARMQQGLTDEQLQASFIGSPEYFQHSGGTNKSWVDAMYHDLLGRAPDAGGEQFWVGQLAAGADRAAVALGFAASDEREGQRVQQDYQQFLGRSASAAEVAFWVNQFRHGRSNEDVVSGFVGSDEYFNRQP